MSGDMLTNLLNSGAEIKPTLCFSDYYIRRWQDEVAKYCKVQSIEGNCRLTLEACSYNNCYRRSAFHVNY